MMISWKFIGVFLLAFFLDVVSKEAAKHFLSLHHFEILPSILSLSLHFNTGIALSLPVPWSAQIFFTLLFLLIFFVYCIRQKRTMFDDVAFALIFAGAVGNFLDRIFFGKVTDFIVIWHFPVFNLADTFIFFGVAFLLVKELQKK